MEGRVRSDQDPDLTQASSGRSKCKGASAGLAPWRSGLKLGREMGTHPGTMLELGTLTPSVKGPKKLGPRVCTAKPVGRNFTKQKLWNTPDLEGRVRSD